MVIFSATALFQPLTLIQLNLATQSHTNINQPGCMQTHNNKMQNTQQLSGQLMIVDKTFKNTNLLKYDLVA
jgi:hypothetical protein